MSKYTKELKIKLVLEYLSWESGGQDKIANKYKIPQSTLKNWILKYQSGGFDNLTKKQSNDKFTSEFKLSVIQYRQITNASLRETAEYFNITNGSLICNWERAYRKKVSSLATGRASRSKEKTKLMLILLEENPETKASE